VDSWYVIEGQYKMVKSNEQTSDMYHGGITNEGLPHSSLKPPYRDGLEPHPAKSIPQIDNPKNITIASALQFMG
jgi:hypothetical protein